MINLWHAVFFMQILDILQLQGVIKPYMFISLSSSSQPLMEGLS